MSEKQKANYHSDRDAPSGEEASKRLNAELPASMHAAFKAKAAREGRKMTNVVREMIAAYLEEADSE